MSKVLFIGDSHIFSCFSDGEFDIMYLIDVTINKIMKGGNDLKIEFSDYDGDIKSDRYLLSDTGNSLINLINESDYESIVFSIGEIDVRYHLVNQLNINKNAIEDIMDIYKHFLSKIKKKVLVCSIPPPGIDNSNKFTTMIKERACITIVSNQIIKNMCDENGYKYIDLYSDYHLNGILDKNKSDGGVHIHNRYIKSNLNKIMK